MPLEISLSEYKHKGRGGALDTVPVLRVCIKIQKRRKLKYSKQTQ
jgi:hypothetical protein